MDPPPQNLPFRFSRVLNVAVFHANIVYPNSLDFVTVIWVGFPRTGINPKNCHFLKTLEACCGLT